MNENYLTDLGKEVLCREFPMLPGMPAEPLSPGATPGVESKAVPER